MSVAVIAACLSLVVALAGCSGGGGGSSPAPAPKVQLSGTVSAGSAMIARVSLRDGTGAARGPVETGPDGTYTFDVEGLTPPFYIKAEGAVTNTSYDLYSVAATAGTANVNPLTNVIAAAAAGENDPAAGFNSPLTSTVTSSSINSASAAVTTMLQDLLTSYGASGNPLTTAYAADHTGLDAVMDVVSVEVSSTTGSVTMTNTMNGAQIAQAMTTSLATPTVNVSAYPAAAIMGDIQAIQAMFTQLMTALNKGVTGALTEADLETFFATTFGLYDGLDRAGNITKWALDFNDWGKTYSKMIISVGPVSSGTGSYAVQTWSYFTDGSYYNLWPGGLVVVKDGANWKFTGNGHRSYSLIAVETHRWVTATTDTIKSGIDFYMPIIGGQDLETAHITGPGLPPAGVDMVRASGGGNPYFVFSPPDHPNRAEFYSMTDHLSDAEIEAIPDNSEYTIVFSDSTASVVDTRVVQIPKRPFTAAEAASPDIYMTIPGLTHAIADANIGGTFTFTYTKPAAFVTIWMTTALDSLSGGAGAGSGDFQAPLNVGTISLATTGTATSAWLMLNTTDQYRRSPYLWWEFK
ncbi:MAG: hypothetical protein AABZ15_11505 [Nitrospirota bacterium]